MMIMMHVAHGDDHGDEALDDDHDEYGSIEAQIWEGEKPMGRFQDEQALPWET